MTIINVQLELAFTFEWYTASNHILQKYILFLIPNLQINHKIFLVYNNRWCAWLHTADVPDLSEWNIDFEW